MLKGHTCKISTRSKSSRKRKSCVEKSIEEIKNRATKHSPLQQIYLIKIWQKKRIRYKFAKCKEFTLTVCKKCDVGFC